MKYFFWKTWNSWKTVFLKLKFLHFSWNLMLIQFEIIRKQVFGPHCESDPSKFWNLLLLCLHLWHSFLLSHWGQQNSCQFLNLIDQKLHLKNLMMLSKKTDVSNLFMASWKSSKVGLPGVQVSYFRLYTICRTWNNQS